MTTQIVANNDLYNAGKCFTKGHIYEVNRPINNTASLMEMHVKNDQGEYHIIGSWWREFDLVEEGEVNS